MKLEELLLWKQAIYILWEESDLGWDNGSTEKYRFYGEWYLMLQEEAGRY